MNAKLIILDDVIFINGYANVLVVVLMDDELINVNDVNVNNELIITSIKFLNSSLIILE